MTLNNPRATADQIAGALRAADFRRGTNLALHAQNGKASNRKQHRLRIRLSNKLSIKLTHNAPAYCAEGQSKSELFAAGKGPSKLQVRYVGTSDHQDERDRTEQQR
jgi:hypothetical protein